MTVGLLLLSFEMASNTPDTFAVTLLSLSSLAINVLNNFITVDRVPVGEET